jgi:hypothetical protein
MCDGRGRSFLVMAMVAVAVLAAVGAARAEVAVGVKAGTLGLGAEVTFDLGQRVALRGGVAAYEEDLTYTASEIEYEGDLEVKDATLLLDFYPAGGGFRLTVGAAWNDHRLEGRAPLRALLTQSGVLPPGTLLPVDLGTLRGEATVDPLGPYAGIGFGRATRGGRFGLSLDLGVVYHGDPQVELEADSAILALFPQLQPLVDAALAQETAELEREAEDYPYYPVVSFTLSYRF